MAFSYSGASIPAEHWHPPALAKLCKDSTFRDWPGLDTFTWVEKWGNEALAARCAAHPELCRPLDRYETFTLCHRSVVAFDLQAYAVMAYGRGNMGKGRRYNHLLEASMQHLVPLLEELPSLTRAEAYERFRKLKSRGLLRGIGPSFFTKFMYFFGCRGAYILDQWLAKGVLALRACNWPADARDDAEFELADGIGIRLTGQNKRHSISQFVSGLDYDFFCRELGALAEILGLPNGAEAECVLFTHEEWLEHLHDLDWTTPTVRENRRKAALASARSAVLAAHHKHA